MSSPDLLIAYMIKGSVAKALFESNPDAGEGSGITHPEDGFGVKLSIHLDEMRELREGLTETLKLIKNKDLDEFVMAVGTAREAQEEIVKIFAALEILASYIKEGPKDETE